MSSVLRVGALVVACGLLLGTASAQPGPASGEAPRCDGGGAGPYRVVELVSADGTLVWFGTVHTADPASPMLAELERRVARLDPTLVLFEGDQVPALPTRERAVAEGGEMGLLRWLAARRGIPYRALDLSTSEEARALLRRRTPGEVLVFMMVRALGYFHAHPDAAQPPDLVPWLLGTYGPAAGLPGATEADLARLGERLLGRPWDASAVRLTWTDPRRSELVTQEMARESNALREPRMLEGSLQAATRNARVFFAVGEGHLCNLREALLARWRAERGPGSSSRSE